MSFHASPTTHRRAALIPGDQGLAEKLRAANLASDLCLSDSDDNESTSDEHNDKNDTNSPAPLLDLSSIPTTLNNLRIHPMPRKSSLKRPRRRPCLLPTNTNTILSGFSFSDSDEDDFGSSDDDEEDVPRRVSFKDDEICHELFVHAHHGAVVAAFDQEEMELEQQQQQQQQQQQAHAVTNDDDDTVCTRGTELATSYPRQQRKFLILKTLVRAQHACTADQLARTALLCNAWASDAALAQGHLDYQEAHPKEDTSSTSTITELPSMGLYALPLKRRERSSSAPEQVRRVKRKL